MILGNRNTQGYAHPATSFCVFFETKMSTCRYRDKIKNLTIRYLAQICGWKGRQSNGCGWSLLKLDCRLYGEKNGLIRPTKNVGTEGGSNPPSSHQEVFSYQFFSCFKRNRIEASQLPKYCRGEYDNQPAIACELNQIRSVRLTTTVPQ